MTRSPLREIARIVVIVALAGAAVTYWLTSEPFGALHPGRVDTTHTIAPIRRPAESLQGGGNTRRPRARPSRASKSTHQSTKVASPAAWLLGEAPVLLSAVAVSGGTALFLCLVFLPLRLRARRTRAAQRERYEIVPYRNDVATLERMVQVFQALGATLNRRWFRRVVSGAPSVAFEIHVLPHRDRPARVVLSVVCTPEDARLVDSCLQIAYPDVRVGYEFTVDPHPAGDAPSWIHSIKRLKKLRPFITQVGGEPVGRGDRALEHQLTDDLLVNLAQVAAPVTVQLAVTPVPRWVDRLARRAYRDEEHAIAGRRNAGELGDRSPSADAELRGGLFAQHQLLFYADIRCASSDGQVALLAAQSLSQATGVNRLRVKEPWLLRRLHARRVAKGVPRLLPPVRHGVLSSRELALLWQLPSHRPKTVAIKRSNLLREPASAAVWRPRDPNDAFARDERGPIGIRAVDRRLGVRFTGVPGAGKTTGMSRLWRFDARDPNVAQIGFDPKTEAAEIWLSQVPEDRVTYFLDLARPEFGMSPLLMDASIEVIGDTVVEGLRDINEDGAIMAASDRYLRSATYGALLLARAEGRSPSWYDLYQQLWPEETGAALRQRVCDLCQDNPDLAGLRAFYGSILPNLIKDSRSQVTVRMDAPGNKLARLLGQPTIARMLQHPVQVSIDKIIDERSVLIVQCSMGEVGEEQAVIVLRMLLRQLHTALQRQQLKPPDQRPPIRWFLDEAHTVWGGLLEVMLSTGRSAGLEPTLAWQHSGQIEEERVAKGVLADLQTAINFRCGDPEEAEAISAQAMTAYLTRFSGDQADRDTARFTPDAQLRLPHHFALMQPVVAGEKDKPAIIHFDPVLKDIERIEHHREAQRARGCFYPEDMPDPLPHSRASPDDGAIAVGTIADLPAPQLPDSSPPLDGSGSSATASDGSPANAPRHRDLHAPSSNGATAQDDNAHRECAAGVGASDHRAAPSAAEAPATFVELDFGDVTQLIADKPRDPAAPNGLKCKRDDVRVLALLRSFGPLMSTQIGRQIWPARTDRTVQRRLEAMHRHQLLGRFHSASATRHPFIYVLAAAGHELLSDHEEATDFLDATAKLKATGNTPEPVRAGDGPTIAVSDPRYGLYALGNLRPAGWSLVTGRLLGRFAKRVHGSSERSCALRPPRGLATRSDVAMRGNRSVGDLRLEQFRPIWSDARLDVQVQGHPMIHWYVECERTPRIDTDKLDAYDAMFNGWGDALDGYQQGLPLAVFICSDERSVLTHLAAADSHLTGWVAGLVGKLQDRVYVGRQRIWFVLELDAHRGSMRAWRVPDAPPAARAALGEEPKMRPVTKHLVPPDQLAKAHGTLKAA